MRIAKIIVDDHAPLFIELPEITHEGKEQKDPYFQVGEWSFSVEDDGGFEHVKSSIGSYIAWHLLLEEMERP